MPFFPKYMFAAPCGPVLGFWAWRPVRLYDKRWVWLRKCWRQRMAVHSYLPGPGGEFWTYTDHNA